MGKTARNRRTKPPETSLLFERIPITFGSRFLEKHAGQVIADPISAIVELVANSYDAGAIQVDVSWPRDFNQQFAIKDNGVGMTPEEFSRRWNELNYSRSDEQGSEVAFPSDVKAPVPRVAFGQSGVGRYGAFCFAKQYFVDTWRDGTQITARVEMTPGGERPFKCHLEKTVPRTGHGTCIRGTLEQNLLLVSRVQGVLGTKFLVVPSFKLTVNGQQLDLFSLDGVATEKASVRGHEILIHRIDSEMQHRTTQLHGITWWVVKKSVGRLGTWDGLDGPGQILDGRTAAAKRYSFVIEADILKPFVKPDWSGFHASELGNEISRVAHEHVIRSLDKVLSGSRKKQKAIALRENQAVLGELTTLSRRVVGEFVDQLQQRCPTLGPGDLARTVEVLAKMEKARTGQDLLKELAEASADDYDSLVRILQKWSAREAEVVLSEIERRLKLLDRLDVLVGKPEADELHQIHPLFDRGLWIFGPEYDGVEFTSNRSLTTTLRKMFSASNPVNVRDRADIIALCDGSLSAHSRDEYDTEGEVDGIAKILVLELKRSGVAITDVEVNQAKGYAKHLRREHNLPTNTEIVAFVLGSELGEDIREDDNVGSISIRPRRYDIILKRAHARVFNLRQRIKELAVTELLDPEVEEAIISSNGVTAGNGESLYSAT